MTATRMNVRAACALVFLMVAAVAGIPAFGQSGDDAPLRLALGDAVSRALEGNLDLRIASLDPVSALEDVTIADSVFDPTVDVSSSQVEAREEPTSIFSPLSQTVTRARGQWTDPSRSGGAFTAALEHTQSTVEFAPGQAETFLLVPKNFETRLELNYTQPLLRNFGLRVNRTQVEQAKNNLRISESQFQERVNQLVEDVEAAYWDLVGARRQLGVSRESLRLANDLLEQTRIKVDVGTLPPIEIVTAEAEVAARDEDVIVSENSVRTAEDQLRALMKVPEDSLEWFREIVTVDEPAYEQTKPDLTGAIDQALRRRSAIREAELQLENAELAERFQRDQTRPQLDLTGGFTVFGNSFNTVLGFEEITQTNTLFFDETTDEFLYGAGDPRITETTTSFEPTAITDLRPRGASVAELFDSNNTNFSLTLNLSLPVKNRRARAEHARSKIALRQAILGLEAARQAVRVEVRQAVRQIETSSRRVASARANVSLQRRKLDAEEKRYENGLSTAFQVLEFQNDLQQAMSGEISAIIDYNKAVAALARVQGILVQERNIQIR